MHVRVAWEIYHHQAKQNPEKASSVAGVKPESMLRPHMYPPQSSPSVPRPHEMPPTPPGFPNSNSLPGRPFDQLTANFLSSPSSHLGKCSGAMKPLKLIDSNLKEFPRSDVMLHLSHRHSAACHLTLGTCRWEDRYTILGEGKLYLP